jgi:TIR domain
MPGIFISYRREDSSAYAGRLYDHLVEHFGKDRVFMDVDSLEPGVDFVEVLQNTVGCCDVLIAVIGKQWLTTADAEGRRLDHPEDFVRVEISTALSRNVRVIPALVAGAHMPASHDLPEALAPLARRNAVEISDTSFLLGINYLIESLENMLSANRPAPPPAPAPHGGVPPAPRMPYQAPARINPPAAPPPVELPWVKLPKWRKWLLLYRPYSVGGVAYRFLFFSNLVFVITAFGQLFEGAYDAGGELGAILFFALLAFGFSAGAHWCDQRGIQKSLLGYSGSGNSV